MRPEAVLVVRPYAVASATRRIAEEAAVAIEVDGIGYAVMMATPADLEVFATGFMLTERLADTPADVLAVEPFEAEQGWIVRVALTERCRGRLGDRIRHRTSDTGCGMCGISGLEQLYRPVLRTPPAPTTDADTVFRALAALRDHQPLNAATGALHAAAACAANGSVIAAFEDVGRHNALDKLVGAIVGASVPDFVLVTSRISFEMVDKALVAGAPMLVGVSAPTTMAVDHARANGLTLVALARTDAMLVLNDPWNTFGLVAKEGLEPPTPGL